MMKIEMYTRASCQFCFAAKRLLALQGLDYEEVSLDREPQKLQEMLQRTGNRAVPQVIIDGEPIGGFRELSGLQSSGRLKELTSAH